MTLTADFVTGVPLPFARNRYLLQDAGGVQEGVMASGDLKVAQRAAGANMSVDVAIGGSWVQLDTGTRNGLVHAYNDAVANVAVGAAHATLPRVDLIVLQYNDTGIPAGVGGNVPTLRCIAGVATAGATLDNRNGATALPSDALLLGDVLVPAASSSVVTANIRDRRPWARGARSMRVVTAGNVSVNGTAFSSVGNLASTSHRVECSGRPIRVYAECWLTSPSSAGQLWIAPFIDGALPAALGNGQQQGLSPSSATAQSLTGAHFEWTFTPAAGSHLLALAAKVDTSTGAVAASATVPLVFGVEELVTGFADNT